MLLLQDKRQKNIRIINKMKAKIIEIANEAIELYEDILQYAEFRLDKNDRELLMQKIQRISEIKNRIENV